jgi:predicted enzyme related to lactoylglutathione lyase
LETMNSPVCRAAFVTLATQQFDAIVAFYQALLGVRPQAYRSQVYAEFRVTGLTLGIFQPRQQNKSEFHAAGSGRMSLCLEVTDLERAIAQVSDLGHPPPGPLLTASHGREIYAYDPDGNRLILHQSHSG